MNELRAAGRVGASRDDLVELWRSTRTDLQIGVSPVLVRDLGARLGHAPLPSEDGRLREHASDVVRQWVEGEGLAVDLIGQLGLVGATQATVVLVVPERFRVGASNTTRGQVVYGQPIRRPGFATAIVLHELVHIGLDRTVPRTGPHKPTESLAREVVCMLAEAAVHQAHDTTLLDVWAVDPDLTDFHRAALEVATDLDGDGLSLESGWSALLSAARAATAGRAQEEPRSLLALLGHRDMATVR